MIGALLLSLQVLSAMPDAPHLTQLSDSAVVPPLAVLSAAYIETRGNLKPGVRGQAGEWGRFQIKLETARARCPGMNVRTYEGNTRCFIKMFAVDVATFGTESALCVHNTGRPLGQCSYADGAFVLWKREELWRAGVRATRKLATDKSSTTTAAYLPPSVGQPATLLGDSVNVH